MPLHFGVVGYVQWIIRAAHAGRDKLGPRASVLWIRSIETSAGLTRHLLQPDYQIDALFMMLAFIYPDVTDNPFCNSFIRSTCSAPAYVKVFTLQYVYQNTLPEECIYDLTKFTGTNGSGIYAFCFDINHPSHSATIGETQLHNMEPMVIHGLQDDKALPTCMQCRPNNNHILRRPRHLHMRMW